MICVLVEGTPRYRDLFLVDFGGRNFGDILQVHPFGSTVIEREPNRWF